MLMNVNCHIWRNFANNNASIPKGVTHVAAIRVIYWSQTESTAKVSIPFPAESSHLGYERCDDTVFGLQLS